VPKVFCIFAFPNITKDASKNRTINSGVVFLEGVYSPELVDSLVCRKGRKVQTDEGPNASFTEGIGEEEVKSIFFRGAEQALFITLCITMQEPGFSTQSVPMQQPEKKLALLRRVVSSYGRGERIIRVSLKGEEVVAREVGVLPLLWRTRVSLMEMFNSTDAIKAANSNNSYAATMVKRGRNESCKLETERTRATEAFGRRVC
jgi:hypothetical protein